MKIAGMLTLVTLFVSIALVVVMYYLSGGERPTGGEITLAVAVSLFFVLGCHTLWRRRKQKVKPDTLLLLAFVMAGAVSGCSTVAVEQAPPSPTVPPPPTSANGGGAPVETARKFLLRGQSADTAYGQFSYLLFPSEPATDTQRERYRHAIEAYLRTVSARDAGRFFEKSEINVFYLPLRQATRENVDSVLEYYDYARARAILTAVPGTQEQGPYLISSRVPLTTEAPTQ
ncbi:MAG: hypothetical protein ACT443_06635, partial [Gemmatimonadota bacterium]